MSSEPSPARPESPPRARRPRRAFDRDAALAVALREFWTYGYESTSVSSLTKAMGINPPSLYAAFGDKRQLFSEAVELYSRTYGSVSLEGPDARTALARALKHIAADYTDPSHPPGCLVITAATNGGPGSEDVKSELRAMREATKALFAARVQADIDAGLLPDDTDAEGLAVFYAAVVQGMNQQACDGVGREALERVADVAMAAFPEPAGR
ncbi:TetR/AcrR family transcriptional regulator [Streptomyces sp. ME02-6991-2A]|uniref:TetR/AcrR family transcriptional regulator n=1 Tax=Streptomyces sp. ME02-6991-2A TaxID=3028677 RepID=UPI00100831F9|nr:TetR/AcrR family transcriptional regulator [Streptomyces sp. ME02-6991-2A]MDX3379395.1 TetR/AcrR family transcriptional regulator [Streptomyces sp. ME02-6991-2A]